MKITVKSVTLHGYWVETPGQDIYQRYACPVCGCMDMLQPLAIIEVEGKRSLESVFCRRCQHRFHHRFPSQSWLQNYYQSQYEKVNTQKKRGRHKTMKKLLLLGEGMGRRLRSLVRYGLEGRRDRVVDFCLGVIKDDGAYWLQNARIKKVLEVGCGYGATLMLLKELGYETVGIDANPTRVVACRERDLNVHLTSLDSFDDVKQYGPFDFIYSKHVIEHIVDLQTHVSLMTALLSENGFIYIETPDMSAEIFHHHSSQVQHIHAFSVFSLCKLLISHDVMPVRVCVDNNIQVLGYKGKVEMAPMAALVVRDQPYPDRFVEYLRIANECGNGGVRIMWDHYWIRVERLRDGAVLYEGSRGPWEVRRLPFKHEMIVSIDKGSQAKNIFPVCFRYEGLGDPPVWCKC